MVAFKPREHSLRADLAHLKEARDFAERAAAEFGFHAEACFEVKLALSEAISNAIQHGSSSPADVVHVAARELGGALAFEVADSGRFVPRVMRRGAMPESGRGLEFMRRLMDEVEVRPRLDGTLLRLTKRLD